MYCGGDPISSWRFLRITSTVWPRKPSVSCMRKRIEGTRRRPFVDGDLFRALAVDAVLVEERDADSILEMTVEQPLAQQRREFVAVEIGELELGRTSGMRCRARPLDPLADRWVMRSA